MKFQRRQGTRMQAVFGWAVLIRGCLLIGVPLIYFAVTMLRDSLAATPRDAANEGAHSFESSAWDAAPVAQRRLLGEMSLVKADYPSNFNCTPPAILDFPRDIFTSDQRQHGAALCHVFVALYLFILLAIVCDEYFVPCIEQTIEIMGVSEDVGGATLMAAATSSPELFINVVGTFVTEGDLGVGAVLGSAVFNILAVPAFCGIFAAKEIYLDWWPMTRDCSVYALSILALIICLADEVVYWYEAAVLVAMYVAYIILMYYNVRISQWARSICTCWAPPPEATPLLSTSHQEKQVASTDEPRASTSSEDSLLSWLRGLDFSTSPSTQLQCQVQNEEQECAIRMSTQAEEDEGGCTLWKVVTAPIRAILWLTIPDCQRHPRLFLLTFAICVTWIGTTTYVITWMITVVGDTLRIPDSVMGITFLAAGTSVPEAVSSVIVTKQGHGGMGISNSIGSNTFDILLCLGVPWLIKSAMLASAPISDEPPQTREQYERAVVINSDGLEYSALSLLSATLLLFVTFGCYHFRLNKRVGMVCLVLYAIFLTFASLVELNVFFPVNLPICPQS